MQRQYAKCNLLLVLCRKCRGLRYGEGGGWIFGTKSEGRKVLIKQWQKASLLAFVLSLAEPEVSQTSNLNGYTPPMISEFGEGPEALAQTVHSGSQTEALIDSH